MDSLVDRRNRLDVRYHLLTSDMIERMGIVDYKFIDRYNQA